MKHVCFPAVSASACDWMGDESLQCLSCQGKFGRIIGNLRCEPCGLIFRLQDVLYSERFPAVGVNFVTPDLRGVYHKALEISDTYIRGLPGDKGSPCTPGVEAEVHQTTSKARPPVKKKVHFPVKDPLPSKLRRKQQTRSP